MTDPNYWGPPLWNSLHIITFDYPIEPRDVDKQNYQIFFHSLKNILPCEQCRQHYAKMIEETLPIEAALKSRDSLTRWLVNVHNLVNKRLGKPIVSYDSVKEKYEALSGKCAASVCTSSDLKCKKSQQKTNNMLYLITILLMIVILLTICYLPFSKQRAKIHIIR